MLTLACDWFISEISLGEYPVPQSFRVFAFITVRSFIWITDPEITSLNTAILEYGEYQNGLNCRTPRHSEALPPKNSVYAGTQ